MYDKRFMLQAIKASAKNVDNGGGPFGAVIVKEGKIVAIGTNRVTCHNDPTAHAEITAIRDAARNINSYDLRGEKYGYKRNEEKKSYNKI